MRPSNLDKLAIVAGVTCAGKTTLINRILGDECPDNLRQFFAPTGHSWAVVGANKDQFDRLYTPSVRNMIIHLDVTYRDYSDDLHQFIVELTNNARRTSILTICAGKRELLARSWSKLWHTIRAKKDKRILSERISNMAQLLSKKRNVLSNDAQILSRYESWERYVDRLDTTQHILVNHMKGGDVRFYQFDIDTVGGIVRS